MPHAPAGKDSLGELGRQILKGASIDEWRRKQQAVSGAAYPDGRFDDAGHADGEAA